MAFDCFISYASEDRQLVEQIVWALRGASISVWWDKGQVLPGDRLSEKINEDLRHSRFGIVIVSRAFVAKAWPQAELRALAHRSIEDSGRVLIPVLVEIEHSEFAMQYPILADIVSITYKSNLADLISELSTAIRARAPVMDNKEQHHHQFGDIESWTKFHITYRGDGVSQVIAEVDFPGFLAQTETVRQTWLSRDYSADFYRMHAMSVLCFVVCKKIGALMVCIAFNPANNPQPDSCTFEIRAGVANNFGHPQQIPLVSWKFDKALFDKIDWVRFDDRYFFEIAPDYKYASEALEFIDRNERSDDSRRADDFENGPDDLQLKRMVIFRGDTRIRLIDKFIKGHDAVAYMLLKNGRSMLSFTMGNDVVISVSGGKDRQPNLQNYYLSVDTIRVTSPDGEQVVREGFEGECHFKMNRSATRFFHIKCDVYHRQSGIAYSLYLEKIRDFQRSEF